MAVDRSIIEWKEQFRSKNYIEIYNMLVTNERAIYGDDIDLSVNVADGEKLRMLAQLFYDFGLLSQAVYHSLDINNARGQLLDILLKFAGNMTRRGNTKTSFTGELTWDGDGEFLYNKANDIVLIQDRLNMLWVVKFNNDGLITGSTVNSATITCLNDGDYVLETPISELSHNGNFITNENIAINAIIIDHQGSTAETDAEFKARKKGSLIYNSSTLSDSIKSEIMNNILSVSDVMIYHNPNQESGRIIPLRNAGTGIDQITIPHHDIFVILKPKGLSSLSTDNIKNAIAKILQRKITLGISTVQADLGMDANYQKVELKVNQDYDQYKETFRYYIAKPYNPAIIVNYKRLDGFIENDVLARIRKAFYEASLLYRINQNINVAELANIAKNCNLDLNNPTFEITSVTIADTNAMNNFWLLNGPNDSNITLNEVI